MPQLPTNVLFHSIVKHAFMAENIINKISYSHYATEYFAIIYTFFVKEKDIVNAWIATCATFAWYEWKADWAASYRRWEMK